MPMRRLPRYVLIAGLVALVLAASGSPQAQNDRAKAKAFVDSIWPKLELIPLMVNGDKANRINIVIINRWSSREAKPYNNPGMKEEFLEDARSVVRGFTAGDPKAVTPVGQYSKFYNLYAIWWPDPPIWDPNSPDGLKEPVFQEIRDRFFLPWKTEDRGWVTLMAMLNTDGGGGGAARDPIARTGDAYIAGREIAGFIHEFGHTAPRVSDEYTSIGTWGNGAESNNTTNETRRDFIKWRAWIDPSTPIPTPYTKEFLGKVGLFEGGQSRLTDHFRPTAQSCLMGAGIFGVDVLCPVCIQHFILRHYQLVDPIEKISPEGPRITIQGEAKIHFSVGHLRPEPDTQRTEWILNGKTVASGVDEVDVAFGPLPEYELVFRLTDATTMIRPDPPYADFPKREVRWTVVNSRPSSQAAPLVVTLKQVPPTSSGRDDGAVTAVVAGGVPPYHYLWADGRSGASLKNLGDGLYELNVVDSEFRTARAACVLPRAPQPSVNDRTPGEKGSWRVKVASVPSAAGETNGKIEVDVSGGREPYSFLWADTVLRGGRNTAYPAAAARHSSPVPDVGRDPNIKDGNLTYLRMQAGGGWIEWTVRVLKTTDYPLEFLYTAPDDASLELLVNGRRIDPAPRFPKTPAWREWKSLTVKAPLAAGDNIVRLTSPAAPGINVDSLIAPETAQTLPISDRDRQGLAPGAYTLTVKDAKGSVVEKTITVSQEPGFLLKDMILQKSGGRSVRVANPRNDFRYYWYADDASARLPEKPVRPLHSGLNFSPPAPGNYYVAVRKTATGAESANRIGFAVTMDAEAGRNAAAVEAVRPDAVRAGLLLWLDAADTDGDGTNDVFPHKRGTLLGWKGKAGGVDFADGSMVFYKRNQQNGLGVASWETIWLQRLNKPVKGYQTLILAYKDHSLSRPGTSPFSGLSPLIGKIADPGPLFPSTAPAELRTAEVFLNGRKVDPFRISPPQDFSILTVVFGAPIDKAFDRTDTHWSGTVGEFLVYDGRISETERAGVEEYLRRKWIASFDLERPAGAPPPR